jgi:hypothetical protein
VGSDEPTNYESSHRVKRRRKEGKDEKKKEK